MISSYPLTWPYAFPRCKSPGQSQFKSTLAAALNNVQTSMRLFATDSGKKIENLTISSNVTLGAQNPKDSGVALWFVWDGLSICIAVDRYSKVQDNLQAIHHIIEARRTELRHGTLALVRATFTGFKALPSPNSWWTVLGFTPGQSVTKEQIEARYRDLAKAHHPDRGGDANKMAELTRAKDEGIATL